MIKSSNHQPKQLVVVINVGQRTLLFCNTEQLHHHCCSRIAYTCPITPPPTICMFHVPAAIFLGVSSLRWPSNHPNGSLISMGCCSGGRQLLAICTSPPPHPPKSHGSPSQLTAASLTESLQLVDPKTPPQHPPLRPRHRPKLRGMVHHRPRPRRAPQPRHLAPRFLFQILRLPPHRLPLQSHPHRHRRRRHPRSRKPPSQRPSAESR